MFDKLIEKYTVEKSKVLVLAPHPDDEIIGCGGTLLLHKLEKSRIKCVYLNRSEQSIFLKNIPLNNRVALREKEVSDVAGYLCFENYYFLYDVNIKSPDNEASSALSDIVNSFNPDVLMLPWYGENHVEHKLFTLLLKNTRLELGILKYSKVLAYEVWSPIPIPTITIDITSVFPEKKFLLKKYKSMLKNMNYMAAMEGLNSYRSIYNQNGKGYAEVFLYENLGRYLFRSNKYV